MFEVGSAHEAATRNGPTLICRQHGKLPSVITAFGTVTPALPSTWPDNRLDMAWVVTPHAVDRSVTAPGSPATAG
jgi:hypothetical protein